MHEVIIDGKKYIEETKAIRMIYEYFTSNQDLEKIFEEVENALGFKLFAWQKSFIETGMYRRSGKTLAEILRLLLAVDGEPLDFTRRSYNPREEYFKKQLYDIETKLKKAGVPVRKVFWDLKEKRLYELSKEIKDIGDSFHCASKSVKETTDFLEKRLWI